MACKIDVITRTRSGSHVMITFKLFNPVTGEYLGTRRFPNWFRLCVINTWCNKYGYDAVIASAAP